MTYTTLSLKQDPSHLQKNTRTNLCQSQ